MKGVELMIKNLAHKLTLTSLIILLIFSVGCKNTEEKEIAVDNEADTIVEVEGPKDPDEIMKEFYQMINGEETTKNILNFVINNIENLQVKYADTMILDYESHQIKDLNILLKDYEDANSNPELYKIYNSGIKDSMADLQDVSLKDILNRTLSSGYIILEGEGYIYPEIDYQIMLDESEYLSKEVIDYLEIMKLETQNRFTYGERLEISLKELLDRVLSAENYLTSNVGSKSSNKIYELYVEYMDGVILGTGNPYVLANEGTSIIKDEILDEYKTFIHDNKDSKTAEILQEYISILEANNNDMDAPKLVEFYDNRYSNIKEKFRELGL